MISFKRALISDSEAISVLVNSAYRGESSKLGWTTEADLLDGQRTDPEKIQEMIEEENSFIELVLENNEIIGSVHLRLENNQILYFGMLTVNPKLQNKGIGKLLLNQIEVVAKKNKCIKIRMTVIPTRIELILFYERYGFKRSGNFEPFPEGDPRFGIPKVSGLRLDEFEKIL